MTFEEVYKILKVRDVTTISTWELFALIDGLKETYAPKIKMTFKQKDNLMLFIDEDDDFEDFWCYFGQFGYGIELYKEFSESELMRAWLHPELIEVSDE